MSRENVETVRRMYDAHARGDFELSLSCLDPEIEFSQPAEEPGAGTYHGHEGVIEAMTKWTGAWDDYRVEVEELIDLDEHVLARTRHHGRGKGSGVEVEQPIFQVWTLRNCKVVRARMYYDQAKAVEAVGLAEPTMSSRNVSILCEASERSILADQPADREAFFEIFDPEIEWDASNDVKPSRRGTKPSKPWVCGITARKYLVLVRTL